MWFEYALAKPSMRKKILQLEKLPGLIEYSRQKKEMLYISYYLYDDEIVEHLDVFKTTSTYRGKYYINKIVLDIDDHDGKMSGPMMKSFVHELATDILDTWKLDEEFLTVWFSGRGYHISIPDIFGFEPSNSLPYHLKSTISEYFPEADVKPLIPTGMIRVGFTYNPKGKCYKVPFTYSEFGDIDYDELIAVAKQGDYKTIPVPKAKLTTFPDKIIKYIEKRKSNETRQDSSNIVTCMQTLYRKNGHGDRHNKLLRLGSSWKRQGIPYEGALVMAKEWITRQTGNKDFTLYEVGRLISDIYRKHYPYSCKDVIFRDYCNAKCMFYKYKNYGAEVQSAAEIEKEYIDFVHTDFSKIAFDLNGVLDIGHQFIVFPGDLMVIWGDTGMGKSALAQNIIVGLPHLLTLYYTLEYPSTKMFRRMLQIKHGWTKRKVNQMYIDNTEGLHKELEHVDFISTAPTIETLKKTIIDTQAKIIVLDTAGDLDVPLNIRMDPMKYITQGLKAILQELKVIIIAVHHISKDAAQDQHGKKKRLTVHSGLGSSSLEHKANVLIGIEGITAEDPKRTIKTLKANDERPFSIENNFDWNTFRFVPTSQKVITDGRENFEEFSS